VNIAKAYTKGSQDAPVVFVEFADYECPYCQKVNPQIQQLKKDYGDKLAIVYKDFPLPMHHGSEKAAEAARCAGEQGKFWEYHDVLFYSRQIDVDALKEHARVLKLDGDAFDTCLDSGRETNAVKQDLEEAKGLGLTGTPSFFCERTLCQRCNRLRNAQRHGEPAAQLCRCDTCQGTNFTEVIDESPPTVCRHCSRFIGWSAI